MKHALAALVLLAACTTDDVVETDTTDVARRDPGEPTCPEWGCGANSATVGDGLIFDELDGSKVTPNHGGLTITGTKLADGRDVTLRVSRDSLYAIDSTGAEVWNVTGAIINLQHPTNGVYQVLIAATHKSLTFWAGKPDPVPSYTLLTRRLGELKFTEYACRSELTSDPDWTGPVHSALFFQWDRYDAKHKKVTETASNDPWFNVACAGTAPAKMHLTRHTKAGSSAPDYVTTVAQRQAMLKMFTADYCGTGHTFTVDGTPLAYMDSNHWLPVYGSVTQESLWTEAGALCLDTPRLVEPALVDEVCGYHLPACDVRDWESRAHVSSRIRAVTEP